MAQTVMNEAERDLLNELLYGTKNLKVRFDILIGSAIEYVNDCEEEGDEPEMSEQFMTFLMHIKNKQESNPYFNEDYKIPTGLFEAMFNSGLQEFQEDTILDHINKVEKDSILLQSNGIDPMSTLELEVAERTTVLWGTEIDLVGYFESLRNIKDIKVFKHLSWDFFKDVLQGRILWATVT